MSANVSQITWFSFQCSDLTCNTICKLSDSRDLEVEVLVSLVAVIPALHPTPILARNIAPIFFDCHNITKQLKTMVISEKEM